MLLGVVVAVGVIMLLRRFFTTSTQKYTRLSDLHVSSLVPSWGEPHHKGQHGSIGVIGGSQEYTGAAYYAASSALKCGADLAHVFCAAAAGTPIKCYSPELIVHPCLDVDVGAVEAWLPRMHTLVVGPGLGRDPAVLGNVARIIDRAREGGVPLVVDADGLFLVSENLDLIRGYPQAVITPNIAEFRRLWKAAIGDDTGGLHNAASAMRLARELDVTVVLKGATDAIASPGCDEAALCSYGGSPRRCGGQGDILAGTVATFVAWAHRKEAPPTPRAMVAACFGGAAVTRKAAERAFDSHGRATTTPDILQCVGPAFGNLFD